MLMNDSNHLIQIKTTDEQDRAILFEIKVCEDETSDYIILSKFMDEGIDDIDSIRLTPAQIDIVIESLQYAKKTLLNQPHWDSE